MMKVALLLLLALFLALCVNGVQISTEVRTCVEISSIAKEIHYSQQVHFSGPKDPVISTLPPIRFYGPTAPTVSGENARGALMALFNTTNGPWWTNRDGWGTPSDPCLWYGIHCLDNGVAGVIMEGNNLVGEIPQEFFDPNGTWPLSVVVLSLSNNLLSGNLPEAFGTMVQMTRFRLYNNRFTGSISPNYGMLVNLIDLALYSNFLSGPISPSLGNLTVCQQLWLHDNSLRGDLPDALAGMQALRELFVFSNNLSGELPERYAELVQLEKFWGGNNEFSGHLPSSWSVLSSMDSFDVHGNQLEGQLPPSYVNWTLLSRLYIHENGFSGEFPASYASMTKLVELCAYMNHFGGVLPEEWGAMTSMEDFVVSDNWDLSGVLPDSYASMTHMRLFMAWNSSLTGPLPTSWSTLSELTVVGIYRTHINGELPENWGTNMTQLALFNAFSCNFVGELPASWGKMKSLWYVDMEGSHLVGSIPVEWSNLPALRILRLPANQLGGLLPSFENGFALQILDVMSNHFECPLPTFAPNSSALVGLYLGRNAFEQNCQLPPEWGSIRSIQFISLTDCGIRSSLPEEWGQLAALHTLILDVNDLFGEIPHSWLEMKGLQHLKLSFNPKINGVLNGNWVTAWPNLVDISLDGCMFQGELPSSWYKFEKMEHIILTGNPISGGLPSEWSHFGNTLKTIELSSTEISGQLPSVWSNLTNLSYLRIAFAYLDGELPADWKTMKQLQSVDLSGNALCGILPPQWGEMAALTQLNLANNQLGGSLPVEWGAFENLASLDVSGNQLNGTLYLNMWRNGMPKLTSWNFHSNQLSDVVCPPYCIPGGRCSLRYVARFDVSDNALVRCPSTVGCSIEWFDMSNNPDMVGTCGKVSVQSSVYTTDFAERATSENIGQWLAAGTALDKLSSPLPPTLTMLDVRYSESLTIINGVPETLGYLYASSCSNLHSTTIMPPPRLSNGLYTAYTHTSNGLPETTFYGPLVDVLECNYRCPQILSQVNKNLPMDLDDTYYDFWSCACERGTYGLPPNCMTCPQFLDCNDVGTVCPTAEEGMWADFIHPGTPFVDVPQSPLEWNDSTPIWRRCGMREHPSLSGVPLILHCHQIAYDETACNPPTSGVPTWRNNSCVQGYCGRACADCSVGYGHVGARCKECDPRSTWLFPVLFAAGFVGVCYYLLKDRKEDENDSGAVGVVLFALQAVSQLDELNVPSGSGHASVVLPAALQWARLGVVKAECIGLGVDGQMLFAVFAPYILAMIPLMIRISFLSPSFASKFDVASWSHRTVFALSYAFYGSFVPVMAEALRVLQCDSLCDGMEGGCLLSAPYFACPWSRKGPTWIAVVALLALIVHVSILVLLLWSAWGGMKALHYMVQPYRTEHFRWEIWTFLRKLVYSLGVGAVGVRNPVFVPLVGGVLALNAGAIWRWKPYQSQSVNRAEALTLALLAIIYAGVGILLVWPSDLAHPEILGPFLYGLAAIMVVGCMFWIKWDIIILFWNKLRHKLKWMGEGDKERLPLVG